MARKRSPARKRAGSAGPKRGTPKVNKGQRLPPKRGKIRYAYNGKARRFSSLPKKVQAAWRSTWQINARKRKRAEARALEASKQSPIGKEDALTRGRFRLFKDFESYTDVRYMVNAFLERHPVRLPKTWVLSVEFLMAYEDDDGEEVTRHWVSTPLLEVDISGQPRGNQPIYNGEKLLKRQTEDPANFYAGTQANPVQIAIYGVPWQKKRRAGT
jgi:hypothetical protein